MSSLVHYVRSSIGEDWSQYQDPSTNNTYWHNSKTDEFFWSNLEQRQLSSADHWWEQYENPENAQPYWVNTTTSEYFHVGQQSSKCLASGSVTDELGAATEHTEVFVSGVRTPAVPSRTISHKQAKDEVIRALYERMNDDEEDLRQHADLPWCEAIVKEVSQWKPFGILKRCTAKLFTDEADPNYSNKPRLDLVFYYADDSWIRWHPGAKCIYSHEPISDAVQGRRNRFANLQHAQNSTASGSDTWQ